LPHDDAPLTIELDESTRARVEAAAAAAGLSVEAYVREILRAAVSSPGVAEGATAFEGPHDWTEANRRLEEYDRTGVSIPLEDALKTFDDALEAALARSAKIDTLRTPDQFDRPSAAFAAARASAITCFSRGGATICT